MEAHGVFATTIPVFMLTMFLGGNNKLWVDGTSLGRIIAWAYLISLVVAEAVSLVGVAVEIAEWMRFVSLAGCLIGLLGVSLMAIASRSARAQRWIARQNRHTLQKINASEHGESET